ncbi:CRISPR-associated helicase/endonuclease Cas3 [Synergistales bacterium]|nr:CRISPR-associated helicase/endonuclease Cas3 [Synergistales bacterium]
MLQEASAPQEKLNKLLRGSLSGDLKSHKDKLLCDHLSGTALLAIDLLRLHGLDELEPDVLLAAYTHDVGKTHPDFQERLRKNGKGKGVEHSAPSSFFTISLAEDLNIDLFDAFLCAEAVRRHHTGVENWQEINAYWLPYHKSLKKINADIKLLAPQWTRLIQAENLETLINIIDDMDPDDGEMHDAWFKLRTILSLLVAGDRMDAIDVAKIQFHNLPTYQKPIFPQRNEMDKWRADVAEACEKRAREIRSPGIYTLTLPTGSGKTNIGLNSARIIAENLGYETIIYALPFISIVEQNAAFAKQVFDPSTVQEDHSLMLSKADDENEKEKNYGDGENWKRMSRLFRYWNSPVVVTTMVQLWETIYSPRAAATMDFHRLNRAVVILDEPQGISPRLWYEFGKTLEYIHEKWKTVFIFMTATQPEIAKGVELAPKIQFPFKRHRYKYLPGKYTVADLPGVIKEHTPFAKESGLIVMNTRKSALSVFLLIKQEMKDIPVYMLSRWMSPQHRRETLEKIKSHQKDGERHYLVSTQVVEAGVDLDFDWVFRDLGPLDSVIQVAGRCNRSALRKEGIVIIAEISDESKTFSKMVYDSVFLEATLEILRGRPEFSDAEVQEIIAAYYKTLSNRLNPCEVWKRIGHGKWGDYTSLFQKDYYEVPVYIDRDGTLDGMIDELRNMDRSLENRERLKSLQNSLQQYAIGVNERDLKAWSNKIGSFFTDEEQKLEFVGDDYCVIRGSGIGVGAEHLYHPIAGFQPLAESSEEDY